MSKILLGLEYTYDGQLVLVQIGDEWLLATVACAAGDMARVVNELHDMDIWVYVNELRSQGAKRSDN